MNTEKQGLGLSHASPIELITFSRDSQFKTMKNGMNCESAGID
jgi:hypothetical protein